MLNVSVVRLPSELEEKHLLGRVVVVFDVLRATTSIATAIASGAKEVRILGSLDEAQKAGHEFAPAGRLICGELNCLMPPGFDLGNSPGDYASDRVKDHVLFLSTTNGTRAVVAARSAPHVLAGALVNAQATAKALFDLQLDVTLLCAGTNGQVAPEDVIGAGAVIDRLNHLTTVQTDPFATEALQLFTDSALDLPAQLRLTQGGKNIIKAGLDPDIDFAARLDVYNLAVIIRGDPPTAQAMIDS